MMRRCVLAFLACLAAWVPAHAVASDWTFRVLLDGKPIGQHRFAVDHEGDDRRVSSQADFAVRFLGFEAYRYRHEAVEHWQGNCLVSLAATTDDNGEASAVRAKQVGATLEVATGRATQPLDGCVMSFAYWNPAIRTQTRLLNPQTGRVEAVRVTQAGSGLVDVRGVPTPATRIRISGPEAPIDVWYSPDGEWLGLDSIVSGRYKLSYRL